MATFLFVLLLSTILVPSSFGGIISPEETVRPAESPGRSHKGKVFDYIIIGGGTAGLTVAARLAQSGRNNVAVIEAGGYYENNPEGNLSVIPADDIYYAGASPSDTNPLIDWGFVTIPQTVSGRIR